MFRLRLCIFDDLQHPGVKYERTQVSLIGINAYWPIRTTRILPSCSFITRRAYSDRLRYPRLRLYGCSLSVSFWVRLWDLLSPGGTVESCYFLELSIVTNNALIPACFSSYVCMHACPPLTKRAPYVYKILYQVGITPDTHQYFGGDALGLLRC